MKRYNRILIVDDNEVDIWVASKIIEYTIPYNELVVARSGPEALRYFAESVNIPDLVFVDLYMPLMNGFHLIKTMIESHPEFSAQRTRIIPLSVSENIRDVDAVKRLGITDFILKPLDQHKLRFLLSGSTYPDRSPCGQA